MVWLLGGYMWLYIHRPFEVWPVWGALQVERVYMLAMIAFWAIAIDKSWIRNWLNVAFVVFAIVLTASWAFSPYSDLGTSRVEEWFKVAVFYVLILSTIHTDRDLKRLAVMYLAAVALYMAHSLWEYRCGRFQWTMGTARLLGIDVTNGDPNTFAATLLYSLPLALAVWRHAQRWWQHGLLAGYAALSVGCILLTSSRSAFVGLGFLLLIVAMLSKHRLVWLLLLALAAPVAWQVLPKDRQNRFLTLIDPSYGPENARESAEGRAKGLRDGLRLWNEHPVLGVGPGAFAEASGSGYESHQLYGQIVGELGGLGAVAFLAILAAFAYNALVARRLCREQPEQKGGFPLSVTWAVSLTVALLLLMGVGGHNLYRYTWLWFGAFQAVALDCMRRQAHEAAEEPNACWLCSEEKNDRNASAAAGALAARGFSPEGA